MVASGDVGGVVVEEEEAVFIRDAIAKEEVVVVGSTRENRGRSWKGAGRGDIGEDAEIR